MREKRGNKYFVFLSTRPHLAIGGVKKHLEDTREKIGKDNQGKKAECKNKEKKKQRKKEQLLEKI